MFVNRLISTVCNAYRSYFYRNRLRTTVRKLTYFVGRYFFYFTIEAHAGWLKYLNFLKNTLLPKKSNIFECLKNVIKNVPLGDGTLGGLCHYHLNPYYLVHYLVLMDLYSMDEVVRVASTENYSLLLGVVFRL